MTVMLLLLLEAPLFPQQHVEISVSQVSLILLVIRLEMRLILITVFSTIYTMIDLE